MFEKLNSGDKSDEPYDLTFTPGVASPDTSEVLAVHYFR
jgi:hypothetical protein